MDASTPAFYKTKEFEYVCFPNCFDFTKNTTFLRRHYVSDHSLAFGVKKTRREMIDYTKDLLLKEKPVHDIDFFSSGERCNEPPHTYLEHLPYDVTIRLLSLLPSRTVLQMIMTAVIYPIDVRTFVFDDYIEFLRGLCNDLPRHVLGTISVSDFLTMLFLNINSITRDIYKLVFNRVFPEDCVERMFKVFRQCKVLKTLDAAWDEADRLKEKYSNVFFPNFGMNPFHDFLNQSIASVTKDLLAPKIDHLHPMFDYNVVPDNHMFHSQVKQGGAFPEFIYWFIAKAIEEIEEMPFPIPKIFTSSYSSFLVKKVVDKVLAHELFYRLVMEDPFGKAYRADSFFHTRNAYNGNTLRLARKLLCVSPPSTWFSYSLTNYVQHKDEHFHKLMIDEGVKITNVDGTVCSCVEPFCFEMLHRNREALLAHYRLLSPPDLKEKKSYYDKDKDEIVAPVTGQDYIHLMKELPCHPDFPQIHLFKEDNIFCQVAANSPTKTFGQLNDEYDKRMRASYGGNDYFEEDGLEGNHECFFMSPNDLWSNIFSPIINGMTLFNFGLHGKETGYKKLDDLLHFDSGIETHSRLYRSNDRHSHEKEDEYYMDWWTSTLHPNQKFNGKKRSYNSKFSNDPYGFYRGSSNNQISLDFLPNRDGKMNHFLTKTAQPFTYHYSAECDSLLALDVFPSFFSLMRDIAKFTFDSELLKEPMTYECREFGVGVLNFHLFFSNASKTCSHLYADTVRRSFFREALISSFDEEDYYKSLMILPPIPKYQGFGFLLNQFVENVVSFAERKWKLLQSYTDEKPDKFNINNDLLEIFLSVNSFTNGSHLENDIGTASFREGVGFKIIIFLLKYNMYLYPETQTRLFERNDVFTDTMKYGGVCKYKRKREEAYETMSSFIMGEKIIDPLNRERFLSSPVLFDVIENTSRFLSFITYHFTHDSSNPNLNPICSPVECYLHKRTSKISPLSYMHSSDSDSDSDSEPEY